jgi:uncharacterized membrane protein
MSRARTLIFAGSSALFLGAALLAWVNDSATSLYAAEFAGLLLVGLGILLFAVGSVIFCTKAEP